MRWPRRILLYLMLPIFAFLVATAILQGVSQLNAFARQVEGLLEGALGREIKIAGGIEANLFRLNPSVVLKDVTIANTKWAQRPDMAQIARLKVEARLWPVLIGEIRMRRITAEGARIWLESRPDGRANWIFTAVAPKPGEKPKPLRIGETLIVGANVVHSGGPDTPATRAAIHSLSVTGLRPDANSPSDPKRVRARGSIDGLPFQFEVRTGPIRELLGGKGGAISLEAKLGAADVAGDLTVAPGERLRIEGRLVSKRIAIGRRQKVKPPVGERRAGPRKPDAPVALPVALLRHLSLDIAFTIGRIDLPSVQLAKLAGTLKLEDGKLVVKPARAVFMGTPLAGTLSLDANAVPARLTVALAAGRIAAKNLKTVPGGPVIARGQLELAIRAVSRGDDVAALSRGMAATVTAKLRNASVIDLPWRPKGARTAVPRLDVTVSARGLAVPAKTGKQRPAAVPAGLTRQPVAIRLAGVFGRSDIAGKLTVQLGKRTKLSGTLASRRVELGGVGTQAGKRQPLFGPDPLPIAFIRDVEGTIRYRITRAVVGSMVIPNIASTVTLRSGVMRVRSSGAGADSANVSLVMDARGPVARTALDLKLDDSRLANVIAGKAGLKIPNGSLSLRLAVRGRGNTLKATMGSANGRVVFVMRTPKSEKGTNVLAGLGSGLVGTVSTLATQRGGPLRCIVARIPIVRGVGKSDILLIDTERLSFFGTGTINLKSETVSALFVPRQKFLGVSRIKLFTIKVSGPIDRPKAGLDFGAAAFETAKSTIKIAWLPVQLLTNLFKGKIGETLNFDPCPVAIKQAFGRAKAK